MADMGSAFGQSVLGGSGSEETRAMKKGKGVGCECVSK